MVYCVSCSAGVLTVIGALQIQMFLDDEDDDEDQGQLLQLQYQR